MYTITGTGTWSTQTNRNAAVSRVNSALSSYSYSEYATAYAAGITTTGTAIMNISVTVEDAYAKAAYDAIALAFQTATKPTTYSVSVNKN